MNKNATLIAIGIAACLLALSFPVYMAIWIYPHFSSIITFEKEVNAKQIASHITKMLVMDSSRETLVPESISGHFVAILEEAQADFDLTKIKVFSAEGEVLYSTHSRDIGTVNTSSYFTDVVARGETFSQVVHSDGKTMEGEQVRKDVVETYVPLMRGQRFIGALEIYYDITYGAYSISRFVTKSRIITLLISGFLLLCVAILLRSAVGSRKRLREAEKELQEMKDQIPPLYKLPRQEGE